VLSLDALKNASRVQGILFGRYTDTTTEVEAEKQAKELVKNFQKENPGEKK
jgi:muramoyltetrapeptide carboxypeptidase LdcA involved in peptidoglycan recycling